MEQVICVDDTPMNGWLGWPGDPIFKGVIYTIRSSFIRSNGDKGYHLHEAFSGKSFLDGTEIGYHYKHFRPIRKTSIEIFRAIDRKIFNKKKIDA